MTTIPSGSARSALSVGACLTVAAGLVYYVTRDARTAVPELAAPVAVQAPTAEAPDRTAGATPDAAPVPESDAPSRAEAKPAREVAPSVDVMRVEAGGSALVAGTARPGANVSVLAGDRRLAEVRADEAGRFVAMFDAGASAGPRALTLEAEANGTTTRSEEVMLILPTQASPAAPAPATTRAAEPAAVVAPGSESTAPAPEVVATAILTPDAARVTPSAPPPGVAEGQVAFSSISYGETGAVTVEGFGAAGAALRIYADGAPAGEGRVGSDGRWLVEIADAPSGTYTLRVDQIDATGKVISRTETPFRRETGDLGPGRPGEVAVVVQPGNSLWTLARIHYGDGVRYTRILDANATLISDPDLIYPGQIFRVPEAAE